MSLCLYQQNVSILTKADRCSLFLVQGERGSDARCLVSKLFDVCPQSTLQEMEKKEEIRIPWGTGIVGYVAQSGEPLNIPDAYKVSNGDRAGYQAFLLVPRTPYSFSSNYPSPSPFLTWRFYITSPFMAR